MPKTKRGLLWISLSTCHLIAGAKSSWNCSLGELLIKGGVDINVGGMHGVPITVATLRRNVKLVQMLVKAGANVGVSDKLTNGKSSVHSGYGGCCGYLGGCICLCTPFIGPYFLRKKVKAASGIKEGNGVTYFFTVCCNWCSLMQLYQEGLTQGKVEPCCGECCGGGHFVGERKQRQVG